MKAIIVLSLLGILITGTYSACSNAAAGSAKICCGGGSPLANSPGTNVATCVGSPTDATDAAAATCNANMIYADVTIGSATLKGCSPCDRGKGNAGGVLTTCTYCTDGQASTAAGAACIAASGTAATGIDGKCRIFGAADKSTCVISKNGYGPSDGTTTSLNACAAGQWSADNSACAALTDPNTAVTGCKVYSAAAGGIANCVIPADGYTLTIGSPNVLTACAQDQWSAAGSACAPITPGVTGVANCKVYAQVGATSCVIAKDGFFLNGSGSPTACATGCNVCKTDNTVANCITPASGKYIKGSGATATIDPCPDNCTACTAPVAPATVPTCTHVKAGYKLASGAAAACGAN